MRLQAVERNFEIIGEALNQAYVLQPDLPISHICSIIALRHKIAHGYMHIDHRALWAIYKQDLPVLQAEIEKLV